MPLFLFIFDIFIAYIHSITFIQYIYPSPFAEASLHFLIACLLSGETPPCGGKPRIELGPALQQADALPTEPRRTMNWATPHHELSHAAPHELYKSVLEYPIPTFTYNIPPANSSPSKKETIRWKGRYRTAQQLLSHSIKQQEYSKIHKKSSIVW